MSVQELQNYTYFSKYAKYNKVAKRREKWMESVDRMKQMHLRKYPEAKPEIDWAFEYVENQKVLGSQRALQYGGTPIEKHNSRLFNCLDKKTEFITSEGVKSFINFSDGDKIVVLTHTGSWKNAVVKCYGKQKLHKITVKRNNSTNIVFATKNHRWILSDETITTDLKENDELLFVPTSGTNYQLKNFTVQSI